MLNDNVCVADPYEIGKYVVLGDGDRSKQLIIGTHCIIRSHTVIYAGSKIGDYFSTGHHVMIREDNHIGDYVSIGTSSVIEHHVTIKNEVRIHSQVFIPEYSILEKGCWLGPNVVLTNAQYPLSENVKQNLKGPIICKNAKIGANSTILPGVEIGENALVGAGSVVTKNVPAGAVVVGSPARQINTIDQLPYNIEE
jgi:acetyltransferase-like isoleucine patch superfamily enzyme